MQSTPDPRTPAPRSTSATSAPGTRLFGHHASSGTEWIAATDVDAGYLTVITAVGGFERLVDDLLRSIDTVMRSASFESESSSPTGATTIDDHPLPGALFDLDQTPDEDEEEADGSDEAGAGDALDGGEIDAPPPALEAARGSDSRLADKQFPVEVERAVNLIKERHSSCRHLPEAEQGAGMAVLVAIVRGGRAYVIHAGGRLRLLRLNNQNDRDTLAAPADNTTPLGGKDIVRIEVTRVPLAPGDLIVGLPAEPETESRLLEELDSWRCQVLRGASDADPLESVPQDALPPAHAALVIDGSLAGAGDHPAAIPDNAGAIERSPSLALLNPTPPVEEAGDAARGGSDSAAPAWSELMSNARAAVNDIAIEAAAGDGEPDSGAPGLPGGPDLEVDSELAAELDLDAQRALEAESQMSPDTSLDLDSPELIAAIPDNDLPEPIQLESIQPQEPRETVIEDDPEADDRDLRDALDGAEADDRDPRDTMVLDSAELDNRDPRDTVILDSAEFDDRDPRDTVILDSAADDSLDAPPAPPQTDEFGVPLIDASTPAPRWEFEEERYEDPPAAQPPGGTSLAPDDAMEDDPLAALLAGQPEGAPAEPPAQPDSRGPTEIIDSHAAGLPVAPAPSAAQPVGDADTDEDEAFAADVAEFDPEGDYSDPDSDHRSWRRAHPSVEKRRTSRRKRARLGTLLAVIGVASAVVGAVIVLAFTGGLDALIERFLSSRSSTDPVTGKALLAPVPYTIRTIPSGALLVVDGRPTGLTTPIEVYDFEPGERQVELRLGSFGSWSGQLSVEPKARNASLLVELTGGLSARTSKLVPGVGVFLDDVKVGKSPVVLDSVHAGIHVVRFNGPDDYQWEEEVVVRVDETADVVAPMDGLESLALLTVRSASDSPTGPVHSDGDQVKIDGEARGTSPAEVYLAPGRHLVEVSRAGRTIRRIIDVRAGDRSYVDLRLDRMPGLRIEHKPPKVHRLASSPVIQVEVLGSGSDRRRKVTMHVKLDDRWKMLQMGAVPGAPSSYVVGLPVTSNHAGETVRYYFTTDDAAGQTCFTPIFSVPMK